MQTFNYGWCLPTTIASSRKANGIILFLILPCNEVSILGVSTFFGALAIYRLCYVKPYFHTRSFSYTARCVCVLNIVLKIRSEASILYSDIYYRIDRLLHYVERDSSCFLLDFCFVFIEVIFVNIEC